MKLQMRELRDSGDVPKRKRGAWDKFEKYSLVVMSVCWMVLVIVAVVWVFALILGAGHVPDYLTIEIEINECLRDTNFTFDQCWDIVVHE